MGYPQVKEILRILCFTVWCMVKSLLKEYPAEFEVEIVRYGSGWAGSVHFGVMKISKDKELTLSDVPVDLYVAPNHFVWGGYQLYNNFSHELVRTSYGNQNLDDLREGNRVGLRLDRNGDLSFLVDGRSQGVAYI